MPKTSVLGESSPAGEPYSRCDRCGEVDDHPKHVLPIGGGGGFWHEDDADRDGTVRYHFDCDHEWQDHPNASKQRELALSGIRGDALRVAIQEGL